MEKIVEVISVTDTRQYEEVGDTFKPIPGSGTENECYRCGRVHEVHAEVRLSSGKIVIVGTACSKSEDAETDSKIKSAFSAEKRLRILSATLAKKIGAATAWDAEYEKVKAIPLPEMSISDDGERRAYIMGDAKVYSFDREARQERIDCLIDSWRSHRMVERGFCWMRPFVDEGYFTRKINQIRMKMGQMNHK